jgi:hypothetical protein
VVAAVRRSLDVAAGGGIDAAAVAAKARELGVMGWVRPTGEIHGEGAPDAGKKTCVIDQPRSARRVVALDTDDG